MINDIKSIKKVWLELMYVLNKQQKRLGVLVFIMSVIGALFETVGVSVVIPMVQAMISPDEILNDERYSTIFSLVHVYSASNLIMLMCLVVVFVYLFKNIYLTVLSWVRAKYASKIMRELSVKVMHSYMKRNYAFFTKTDIGALTRGTSGDASGVYSIIYQGFRIVSEGLTAFFICIYIFITDAKLASSVICVGLLCLVLIMVVFRKIIKNVANTNWKYTALVSKYMMEAYSGIKEILVMNRQNYFVSKYEKAYSEQQKATVSSTVAAESPAYLIEAVCISGIIISVAFRVGSMDDPTSFIPQLSAFAIAAFKILPSLGKISNAFNTLVYHIPFLNDAYNDFKEVDESDKIISRNKHSNELSEVPISNTKFMKTLDINSITWKYQDAQEPVLENLSLSIKKGTSVGIIGESGAGKSTLMDILLGLFEPQKGSITFDDVDIFSNKLVWSSIIGYVPQEVYLTNDTLRNNVTFGVEENEISDELVWKALNDAQISDYVKSLPDQLDTIVGDRGVRFSGGQRQRIAIARALYHDPDILVFDEATSALDNDTEAALMESIELLHGKKTLIIVAHRLTTIRNCDEVYEVSGKRLVRIDKNELGI